MNFKNEREFRKYCKETDSLLECVNVKEKEYTDLERFKTLDSLVYKFRDELNANELLEYVNLNELHKEIINLSCFNDEGIEEFIITDYRKKWKVKILKGNVITTVLDSFILDNYEKIFDELAEIRDYLENKLSLNLELNECDVLDYTYKEESFEEYNYFFSDDGFEGDYDYNY